MLCEVGDNTIINAKVHLWILSHNDMKSQGWQMWLRWNHINQIFTPSSALQLCASYLSYSVSFPQIPQLVCCTCNFMIEQLMALRLFSMVFLHLPNKRVSYHCTNKFNCIKEFLIANTDLKLDVELTLLITDEALGGLLSFWNLTKPPSILCSSTSFPKIKPLGLMPEQMT